MIAARSLLACMALAACTRTEPPPTGGWDKTSLSLKGSDTMVILGQRWSEKFMNDHAGITIQVTGGGSGTGIAALINGTTDICQSSRPMKDKERSDLKAKRNADAVETRVALDAIAVYVSQSNPIEELSLAALARIYKGEARMWKEVGGTSTKPIVVYGRENNSGTYAFFKEHVLANKDFASSVQTLAGTAAVVAAVKGDENGIGYGGIAYSEGVKLVKLKKDDASPAIAPSLEAAQNGSYPLSRFLLFYTAGEPTGTVKRFIDWTRSDEGQRVIEEVGYYPLGKQ